MPIKHTLMSGARPLFLAAACALPLAAAAPALAQTASAHHVKHSATDGTAADRVEGRITELHARLHITPELEPQWKQFADVMRANAQAMDANVQARQASLPTMNALDDMQSYEKLADQHAQDMQKLVGAFQTLYGAMNDDQKKVADAVFRNDATANARRKG